MYTAVTILIILTCVLLVLVVLVQNPKGGGISTGIIGSSQVMGVKKTTDFIEKLTWGLAISLVVLCLAAGLALPGKQDRAVGSSLQEKAENAPAPAAPQQQLPIGQQPGQQPAQQQPAQEQPANQEPAPAK
jgi:preprotein translocase subunit SecG